MNKLNGKNLKIAVQQKGRLADASLELLKSAGMEFDTYKRILYSSCRNFPLDILYVRDDDIPQYVANGTVDLGIVGDDVLMEQQKNVKKIVPLHFGYCSLIIAGPPADQVRTPKDLSNTRIATTYNNCLKRYLKKNKIQASIINLAGSVEIAPSVNVADYICDITSTGNTLKMHGLVKKFELFNSQSYLVANQISLKKQGKIKEIERLVMRIKSVVKSKKTKYIMLNAPKKAIPKILKILPGLDSPTLIPLAKKNWVALHSVVDEEIFWEVIEKLKLVGASGILVSPIEKLII